jgi:hypothetical protein
MSPRNIGVNWYPNRPATTGLPPGGTGHVQRVAQHPMHAREPFADQESREGRALVREERLHVARRDAVARRNCGQAETLLAERSADVGLDRMKARGAQTTALGDLGSVARGAQSERNEIVHVSDGEPA